MPPKEIKKIAVFTSGGDSPGMNAAIRAVVRASLYHGIKAVGIERGYKGMMAGQVKILESQDMSNVLKIGGTKLKSARCEEFRTREGREKAFSQLQKYEIDALVAIGGNGTFTAADLMVKEFDIPFIGIPATIDNDLYGTDDTLGFDTAVNTALSCIDKIKDTAFSHERAFFIEVMGRNAGFIALETGIGCGAEMIIVPEEKVTMTDVTRVLKNGKSQAKSSFLIIVAESNQIGDVNFIAQGVKEELPYLDVRVTSLGHIQRGGSPTAHDRILGSVMGIEAVENLIKGEKSGMIGVANGKAQLVPFETAIHHKKELNYNIPEMLRILNR